MPPFRPQAERFWEKVDFNGPNGCWLWTAGGSKEGYGGFYPRHGLRVSSHRWAYEQLVGPIPAGLQLDHLCRVPAYVNPDHLEPVTNQENSRRGETGKWKRPDICKKGHPFDEVNTYIRSDRTGHRDCRICRRNARRRYEARKAGVQ